MALEQKLTPKLQQKLVMTPALQLAIKLLQLNRLELEQTLREEMVENPVLEQREEGREESLEEMREQEAEEPEDALLDNLDVDEFFSQYFDYQPSSTPNMREEGEAPPIENTLSSGTTLTDHLAWQLEMMELDGQDLEICEAIIGNIDPDGFLGATAEEIAAMEGWDLEEVDRCIELVQSLDPPGVGARNLKECLLLQLELVEADEGLPAKIVREHFDLLIKHRFKEIAKSCDADTDVVADALDVVRGLNPRPGQSYSDESPRYITPDVHVIEEGDGYRVDANDDGLPKLRVSALYKKMLQSKNGLSDEATEYLQEKMRSALWLIKSFGQRQQTIRKVAESIVKHQRAFLDHGVTALRPLVLRDVADDIDMHESTVSRVVNGKYMHTPQGIFEMKYFFHSGLGHASGSEVSSVSVKERIRKIVESEDSTKPLSDAAIARKLKEGGLKIARRTVAKYREELGIPASKARRALR